MGVEQLLQVALGMVLHWQPPDVNIYGTDPSLPGSKGKEPQLFE